MKKIFTLSVLLILPIFVISYHSFQAYPKANNPGCDGCHNETPHVYQKDMITVKSNPLSFELNVKNLNKDMNYMMGAEIVDSAGNILKWINHTINLPIIFEVPIQGKYLVYIGGSYNGKYLVYDSMFVETIVDTAAPKIVTVFTHDGVDNKVFVVFDEIITLESAESVDNYSINQDVEVLSAELQLDKKTVELDVNKLTPDIIYELHSESIIDRFGNTSPLLSSSFYYRSVDPGLMAYWPMDEGEGNTVHDFSGNDNHGFIDKAFWMEGIQGKALDFKYKQRFVNAGNDKSLNLGKEFTISMWYYAEKASANFARIFLSSRESWETMNWLLFQKKDGLIEFWFGGSGKNRLFQDKLTLTDYGKWNHIVVNRDDNFWELWINGKLTAEAENSDTIPTGSKLRMGLLAGDDNSMWGECLMDEIRIYNRSLEDEEITSLYRRDMLSNVLDFKSSSLKVYPNPAVDYINIQFDSEIEHANSAQYEINIYDLSGKLIYESVIDISSFNKIVNISNFTAGTYIIKIQNNKHSFIEKLIIF